MTQVSYQTPPTGGSEGAASPPSNVSRSEAQLLAAIDARTDQTRRSWGATAGNALLLIGFVVLPRLPGAPLVFEKFDTVDGLVLPLPALVCVLTGAALHRRLGPTHPLYRALDALELCTLHAFPAYFPLLDEGTAFMSGAFLIVSAVFWGQGKPGRARLYGTLVTLMGSSAVVVFLVRGQVAHAWLATLFCGASVLGYVMAIRLRLEGVRAELERNQLREGARQLRLGRERRRIERALTSHVGAQLEELTTRLEAEGFEESEMTRRLSESVSQFIFPSSTGIDASELGALLQDRCRPLCPSFRLSNTIEPATPIGSATARAVLRVAQELVRNAVVHGRARRVEAVLSAERELVFSVSDDGSGLSRDAYEAASGGLRNARQWLAEAGGTLSLEPRAGFTTSIVVSLPRAPRAETGA